jgi:HEAT repeat protein
LEILNNLFKIRVLKSINIHSFVSKGFLMSEITSNNEEELVGAEKVRVMLESLKSPNLLVRSTGAQNLTDMAIEQPNLTIPILLETLKNDEWYSVRFGALESLSELAKSSNIRLNDDQTNNLIKYLDDNDTDFSAKISECLGLHGNPKSVDPIINHLGSENAEYRELAIIALGNLKNKKAVSEITKFLTDNDYVQSAVLFSLGKIGENDSEFNIEPILSKLTSDKEMISKAAAASLGRIRNKTGIVPLIKALNHTNSTTEGRDEVIKSLNNFSTQEIEIAIKGYSDEINLQIDLIEGLTYHIENKELTLKADDEKKKLVGKYSRIMRRMKSEIDAINAFVSDSFKKLSKISEKEKLDMILDSIPKKMSLLEKIDFEKVQSYTWVKNELYQQIKQAQEWYNLGSGALKELEGAVRKRKEKILNED